MPTAALLSFRLGLTDGVSIVAKSWQRALEELGWLTYTVAGEGPVDEVVPGLEIGAPTPPDPAVVSDALAKADLVVVENLLTIPMNLPASRVVGEVLANRPAILHHHDPAWQRTRFEHITELPPTDRLWQHVTINRYTEEQFRQRGISATTIYNGFNPNPKAGNRAKTRQSLAVTEDELLFVHPVRAIERKNIPAGLAICEAAGATYWLTGQAEEGYGPTLGGLLADARCRVIHQAADDMDDTYAASDLVLFPSSWEGFGNPPIEASLRNKPVVIGSYPVADELRELGFEWYSADTSEANIDKIVAAAKTPDKAMLERNRQLARERVSQEEVVRRVKRLIDGAAWKI